VDANGNPLTGTLQVAVQLDNANHPVISAGRAARLAFDFNLAVSNTVDLIAGATTLTVLAQTGLAVNAPAGVFGFATPFGSAPPDVTATRIAVLPSDGVRIK
jgi:hypothetical protein